MRETRPGTRISSEERAWLGNPLSTEVVPRVFSAGSSAFPHTGKMLTSSVEKRLPGVLECVERLPTTGEQCEKREWDGRSKFRNV